MRKQEKRNKRRSKEGSILFIFTDSPLDVEIGSNFRNCPCLEILITSSTTVGATFAR